jgi:3-hydroxyacyl-[acyl-carrier-protein] dehydratase
MACVSLDGAGDFVGFGGMDEVRFRLPVRPGQRLYMVAKGIKIHRRQVTFNVQGFVDNQLAFHGVIIGIALHRNASGSGGA